MRCPVVAEFAAVDREISAVDGYRPSAILRRIVFESAVVDRQTSVCPGFYHAAFFSHAVILHRHVINPDVNRRCASASHLEEHVHVATGNRLIVAADGHRAGNLNRVGGIAVGLACESDVARQVDCVAAAAGCATGIV